MFQHGDSASVETRSAAGVTSSEHPPSCTVARLHQLSAHHHLTHQTNDNPVWG
jgi:hypothetical protein